MIKKYLIGIAIISMVLFAAVNVSAWGIGSDEDIKSKDDGDDGSGIGSAEGELDSIDGLDPFDDDDDGIDSSEDQIDSYGPPDVPIKVNPKYAQELR